MAIDSKLRKELAEHVTLGEKVGYITRNDKNDKNTMNDPGNLFEKAIKSKQYLEILQAIYDVSADNKFNGAPFAVSQQQNKFIVTDLKSAKSDEIKLTVKPTYFECSDKITKTKTVIELSKVVETEKSEVEPFRTQIEKALKNNRDDKNLMSALKKSIQDYKS